MYASYFTAESDIKDSFYIKIYNQNISLSKENGLHESVANPDYDKNIDWKDNKTKFKFDILKHVIDKTKFENTNKIILEINISKKTRFDLYNFSIQGKQVEYLESFAVGQVKLLESLFELKKNDSIILKKNI